MKIKTGHAERLGVLEVMELSEGFRHSILASIAKAASQGGARARIEAWRVRYRFGNAIVQADGTARSAGASRSTWSKFVTPCEAAELPPCMSCKALKKAIRSPGIPLGVVTKGTAEVHLAKSDSAVRELATRPLRILDPGGSFGLFERGDELIKQPPGEGDAPWEVTAGVRSCILLCPLNLNGLGENILNTLRSNGIKQAIPDSLAKELEETPGPEVINRHLPTLAGLMEESDDIEVIVFSRLDGAISEDVRFRNAIFETAWGQSLYSRRTAVHSDRLELDKSASELYYLKTIQYLVAIQDGWVPGWLPVQLLKKKNMSALQLLAEKLRVDPMLRRPKVIMGVSAPVAGPGLRAPQVKPYEPILLVPSHTPGVTAEGAELQGLYSFRYPLVGGVIPKNPLFLDEMRECKRLLDRITPKEYPSLASERVQFISNGKGSRESSRLTPSIVNVFEKLCMDERQVCWTAPFFSAAIALTRRKSQ